ncbi:CTP synthase 1-like [Rhopilema esculentum]|uniref:CTP synthase 1-like n=1 Tax=Rhopilema esculentum TaxID=499914 RepID=UPI0031D7D747|eukprot:gene17716-9379_t
MKYILVTGGVISGIGKGIISSSIGAMLKACGLRITSIKIDPYLNIDAGTFSPYEHGEVFVLDDGGEVDLDLGNYERFLDVDLHRDNNITTGKIYQNVIEKERKGDYLGKTVQVVPHITDGIQEWVERVASQPVDKSGCIADVCIIELGGVTGDIEGMPYVEAFRQFQFKIGHENICIVHVSLIPQTGSGELKSKPTQMSVRELRGLGLAPDLIMCRGKSEIDDSLKQKISMFCMVDIKQVISVPDVESVYKVPLLLQKQGLVDYFANKLNIDFNASSRSASPTKRNFLAKWKELADRDGSPFEEVTIALVGKYIKLEDAYISVIKALKHASLACKRKLKIKYVDAEYLEEDIRNEDPVKYHEAWQTLCSCDGILVPGGFGSRGTEGKVRAAEWARKTMKPYLGICLGLQIAVIEFARNVLGWKDANSTELDPNTPHPVVVDMPEHNPGQMGGTMRLGKRKTVFKNIESPIKHLYRNKDFIEERHRHRYEVNPSFVAQFEERGMNFVGTDVDGQRMEIIELKDHPYFVAVQFHPEFLSRPLKPSPPYLGFILASIEKLQSYIARGCRLSPRSSFTDNESSSDEDSIAPFTV